MTVNLPQILLLFDTSVILNGVPRIWWGYRRVGVCWLPQTVLDEIRFLCDHAPDPLQKQVAREFFRFYPSSGWRTTDATMPHPTLQPAKGQTLSKRARQVTAIAECAYGVSQRFPEKLVVLAANHQPLLKQMQTLQAPNLCGVTGAALKQWNLSGHRPEAVVQTYQNMKTAGVRRSNVRSSASSSNLAMRTSPAAKHSVSAYPKPGKPTSTPSRRAIPDIHTASRFHVLAQMVSLAISLAGFVIVGLLVWRLVQPQSFEQFWRQNNLPQLIGQ